MCITRNRPVALCQSAAARTNPYLPPLTSNCLTRDERTVAKNHILQQENFIADQAGR